MNTCKMPLETARRHFGKMAICLSIAMGLLIACKPTEPSSPSDEVTLTYAGASESNALFRLENHTSHEIYVPGERWLWSDITSYNTTMVCITPEPHSLVSQVAPFVPPDISRPPPTVTVSPGTQLRLKIPWNHREIMSKYKGNRCFIELQLLTGPRISSSQFEP
jgi:hypothetical protein